MVVRSWSLSSRFSQRIASMVSKYNACLSVSLTAELSLQHNCSTLALCQSTGHNPACLPCNCLQSSPFPPTNYPDCRQMDRQNCSLLQAFTYLQVSACVYICSFEDLRQSAAVRQLGLLSSGHPDTLVLYTYSNSDQEYERNLHFFVQHGMAEGDGCNYVIIVQQVIKAFCLCSCYATQVMANLPILDSMALKTLMSKSLESSCSEAQRARQPVL